VNIEDIVTKLVSLVVERTKQNCTLDELKKIINMYTELFKQNTITIACPYCDGSGKKYKWDQAIRENENPFCDTCNGSGTVEAVILKE
jgi:DnaJ-class molecular chaperone